MKFTPKTFQAFFKNSYIGSLNVSGAKIHQETYKKDQQTGIWNTEEAGSYYPQQTDVLINQQIADFSVEKQVNGWVIHKRRK